jgi:hypothetical protein
MIILSENILMEKNGKNIFCTDHFFPLLAPIYVPLIPRPEQGGGDGG